MPPLVEKWQQLRDSDRDLFPLLECFTSIAQVRPQELWYFLLLCQLGWRKDLEDCQSAMSFMWFN